MRKWLLADPVRLLLRVRPHLCLRQLPCGHEYCKSCVEELRQKGVDKSCPLCRKPLPPGPDQLFDLGYGMYSKIKGAIDRSRPRADIDKPWPALTAEQRSEMDHAVAMLREAADQGHMKAQAYVGELYTFGDGVAKDDRLAFVYYEKAAQQGDALSLSRGGASCTPPCGPPSNVRSGTPGYSTSAAGSPCTSAGVGPWRGCRSARTCPSRGRWFL